MSGNEPVDPWGGGHVDEHADEQPGGAAPRPAPWGSTPAEPPVAAPIPSPPPRPEVLPAAAAFEAEGLDAEVFNAEVFNAAVFGPPTGAPAPDDPPPATRDGAGTTATPPAWATGDAPTSVPGSPLPPPPARPAATAHGFDIEALLPARNPAPVSGFRRLLYALTGRRINLGPSAGDAARDELVARARTPAATGRRRIAMISLKGGVGKTTTTVMLGHTLAGVRGDNVIAIDANPDAGNLANRIRRESSLSARDLLNATDSLDRYADVRGYTSQAGSRLEVLAGEADPALSEAFSASDYEQVLCALERFYSIVLTDCGTGILHDAMRAVLWYADQLVIVTSPAIDSANALGQLLDWLDRHHYEQLVKTGIIVVNGVRKRSEIRIDQFATTFGSRCRSVILVPYDAALSTGGEASLESLESATRAAYLELAAAVGDGFGAPRPAGHDPVNSAAGGLY